MLGGLVLTRLLSLSVLHGTCRRHVLMDSPAAWPESLWFFLILTRLFSPGPGLAGGRGSGLNPSGPGS